ncbi:MAG: hypothetical protein OHK0039_28770 [Bacteroidia bacterium]
MHLNPTWSRLFIILYLGLTFALRFVYESRLVGHYWVSLVTGGLALLFLWALIRSGFLRPGWFWFEKDR